MSRKNQSSLAQAKATIVYATGNYVRKINKVYEERMREAGTLAVLFAKSHIVKGKSFPGGWPSSRTGALKAGYTQKVVKINLGYELQISNSTLQSFILQNGSIGGQIIRPKKAKVLSFIINGKRIFARKVRRGSIEPRPHLTLLVRGFSKPFRDIVCRPINTV